MRTVQRGIGIPAAQVQHCPCFTLKWFTLWFFLSSYVDLMTVHYCDRTPSPIFVHQHDSFTCSPGRIKRRFSALWCYVEFGWSPRKLWANKKNCIHFMMPLSYLQIRAQAHTPGRNVWNGENGMEKEPSIVCKAGGRTWETVQFTKTQNSFLPSKDLPNQVTEPMAFSG